MYKLLCILVLSCALLNVAAAQVMDKHERRVHELPPHTPHDWHLGADAYHLSEELGGAVRPPKHSLLYDTFLPREDHFLGRLSYYDVGPRDGRPVLLLHGASFSAVTWLKTGTLRDLDHAGYRAVAIDMPFGKGDSGKLSMRDAVPIFLEHLLTYNPLQFSRPPVLVVPSMSGAFFFPLLAKSPQLISGFVPIAPVGMAMYYYELVREAFPPSLCVWGEKDARITEKENFVSALGCRTLVIPGAGHAAYLDNPHMFNAHLLKYLSQLE
eukprot:CAMPEP_0177640636 /NCGR_PEP_ID=MMETSP0447-20121125/6647_1 /TAXON_ID=0 /ORGANISM="Stygamoeba regulata, Strain BSH-02190019" /LENGTH=267 /DNA_ID=CAMNT_0019142717 /DNA_START=71 /DNA_END=874 /DNA_ORIENTATION=-